MQMETFVKVVECNSFAAASREIGISTAAVSKQISRLEERLGVQLLKRTTRRLQLTDAGSCYFDQCKKVIEEVFEAESLVSQLRNEPQGLLKVMTNSHFAEKKILPVLPQFLKMFPKITFNLQVDERVPDFEKEGLDIMIGHNIQLADDFVQKKIMSTRYALCAAPEYLKEFGKPNKPSDLANHRYITHSMRNPDNIIQFKGGGHIQVNPYMRINNAKVMYQCALEGMGIIKLHHYVVADAIRNGGLIEILEKYNEGKIFLNVSYLQRRFIPSKIRAFIDFYSSR